MIAEKNAVAVTLEQDAPEHTTYREEIVGRTLYRVTGEHRNKVCFAKAIEDSIIKKILSEEGLDSVDKD